MAQVNARWDPNSGQWVWPANWLRYGQLRDDTSPSHPNGGVDPGAMGQAAPPPAGAPQGLPGGATGSVVGGAAGSGGALGGPSSASLLQTASGVADPWAAQRPQYQTALNNLMQGGTSAIASDPAFQNRIKGGEQALTRSSVARGFLGSGNILQDLQDYGQTQASNEYQNQFNRLSSLAGVNAGSPTAAAGILAQIPGQNLAEQQTGFNQNIATQKLPYELTSMYQGTQAGDLGNSLLQNQLTQMNQAKSALASANTFRPQGFLGA